VPYASPPSLRSRRWLPPIHLSLIHPGFIVPPLPLLAMSLAPLPAPLVLLPANTRPAVLPSTA